MKGKGVDEDWQDDDMGGVGGYSGDEDEDRELDEDDGDNVHDSNGVQEDRQRSCSKTDRPSRTTPPKQAPPPSHQAHQAICPCPPSANRGRFPRPPTDPHEISLRDAYVKKCTRASPTYDDVFDGLADMATFERRRPDGRREWVSFNVTVGPVNTDGDPQVFYIQAVLTRPWSFLELASTLRRIRDGELGRPDQATQQDTQLSDRRGQEDTQMPVSCGRCCRCCRCRFCWCS
mmetsp:Transcript_24548/g.70858  ORF Transcript_24548/g.70858 Transcript_24548/m.70858 type:complete len:232 (+) Transcript_24548:453-1148(+)